MTTLNIKSISTANKLHSFISLCLYFKSLFPFQVTMIDKSAAERACKDPNPIIDGRKANVNLAYLGAKPRSPLTGKYQT